MKKAVKGALWSGLVYPGMGQMVLGSRITGAVFMGLATAGLAVVVRGVMNRVSAVMDQITPILQKGGTGTEDIIQTATRCAGSTSGPEDLGAWLLAACWTASVIHAYLLGKRMDDTPTPPMHY
ncbi:MAG: hypothetical protein V1800_13880 [Candidatus Latescibacterota bacterium]